MEDRTLQERRFVIGSVAWAQGNNLKQVCLCQSCLQAINRLTAARLAGFTRLQQLLTEQCRPDGIVMWEVRTLEEIKVVAER
jgi:hypothetical protein